MENFQPDDFLAGWVGGAAGVLVGHPLDTVKTRLQAGTGYNSMLHCITSIHHKETIRGFFKGMAFPLATVAMCNSVIFGVFGTALRLLSTRRDATTPCKPALFDLISASALSGVAAVAVGSPIELVKIRLQMQVQAPGRQGTFRGPLHCFLTTLQQGGLLGVYRGGGAMLLRDIPGYCTYFVPYTLLCQNLTPQGRQGPHPAIIWLSGGVSGLLKAPWWSWLSLCCEMHYPVRGNRQEQLILF
uniref:Solute carrier family 25 member 48 n=1 Tax=Eptatretus burgeri TaxID=7764 RepID=A0A8C4N9Q8_EPTBU